MSVSTKAASLLLHCAHTLHHMTWFWDSDFMHLAVPSHRIWSQPSSWAGDHRLNVGISPVGTVIIATAAAHRSRAFHPSRSPCSAQSARFLPCAHSPHVVLWFSEAFLILPQSTMLAAVAAPPSSQFKKGSRFVAQAGLERVFSHGLACWEHRHTALWDPFLLIMWPLFSLQWLILTLFPGTRLCWIHADSRIMLCSLSLRLLTIGCTSRLVAASQVTWLAPSLQWWNRLEESYTEEHAGMPLMW